MFRLNRNKQKTKRNSLIESIFWYFSENLGLIRFVLVWFETVLFFFGCFVIGLKYRNKPKILVFGFTKQTETQPKHNQNRSCFGLFRFEPKNFFRFEDTLRPARHARFEHKVHRVTTAAFWRTFSHEDKISPEPVFVDLLWRPGIDSQPGGPVQNPICRTGPPGYIGWRNRFLGIDSWAP
jgi:hypothetical protein